MSHDRSRIARMLLTSLAAPAIAAVLLAALWPVVPARAFPFLNSWHLAASANSGANRCGAGGLYGTGGPADLGIQCAHCHPGAEGLIDLDFAVNPAFQTSGNDELYVPDQVYNITMTLTGEHHLPPVGQPNNNLNGAVMSFEDAGGQALGVLTSDSSGNSSTSCPANAPGSPPNGTTYVYGDCHGILFVPMPNATSWSFSWKAPPIGTGDVNVWWGVVDGNANGDSSLGDDTKQGSFVLLEGS